MNEQLKKLLAQIKKAAEARDALVNKSIEEERSMTDEEIAEYDTAVAKVKSFKADAARLEDQIKQQQEEKAFEDRVNKMKAANAKPVDGSNPGAAAVSQGAEVPDGSNFSDNKANQEKGVAFARYARIIGNSKGNLNIALTMAEKTCQDDKRIINIVRAAVEAGSTQQDNWAQPLVGLETNVFGDFVEFLRPLTVLGRFGRDGIPALRSVPFNVPLIGETSGGEGYWVGEGKAKPLTKGSYERRTMGPLKVANIAVLTEELLRQSSPSADLLIRNLLAEALATRLDVDFINPDKTAVAGVSPASVLNGVTAIPSSGFTTEAVRQDLKRLFGAFIAANNNPVNGVFVMQGTTALALSLMTNALGQPEFEGISMTGGRLRGLPVIVSEYVPAGIVALVNASDIYLGDEGGIQIDMSREASLEMSSTPAGDSTTPTPVELVSMFQTNSVAMRAERIINWSRRRQSAVAYLTGVNWGDAPEVPEDTGE